MVIFFAAGGTGGHIIPAIAVADSIKARRPDCTIVFIGSGKEIEKRLVAAAGYELETIDLLPFTGKGLSGKVKLLLSIPSAWAAIQKMFRRHRPRVIAGFGGYPSFLPVAVSAVAGVPRVINEQNVKAGIANRVLSLIANAGFAVPGAYGFLSAKKIRSVPNPVRSRFFEVPQWQPPDGRPLRLLVVGGSQGAVSLNSAVLECLPKLEIPGLAVTHQTGAKDFSRISAAYSARPNWQPVEFIDDMAEAYRSADIVISRAGAMSVAEICAAGRAAIFVPLAIAGGHQAENAAALVAAGAALMLNQSGSLPAELQAALEGLVKDQTQLENMARKVRQMALRDGARSSDIVAAEILTLAGAESD